MSIIKEINYNKRLIKDLENSVPTGEYDAVVELEVRDLLKANAILYEQHIMLVEDERRTLILQVQILKDALEGDWP